MILLILAFAAIAGHQTYLMRRQSAGRRERIVAYAVTGGVFVYGTLSLYVPGWVNPNKAIEFIFGPIQRCITFE